jgi:hypothetical protein
MAPLLQEVGGPAMPLEVIVEDQQETAFGVFRASLEERGGHPRCAIHGHAGLRGLVADDIIGPTGNVFDEYDVVRQIARAAIVSVADYGAKGRS